MIHDNLEISKKRLLKLHETLKQKPELMKEFKEQKSQGVTEDISNDGKMGQTPYLPHHPAIRDGKNISKVRIVFDASAKGMGPSLKAYTYRH